MDEQIEAPDKRVEIVPIPRELDRAPEPERRCLRAQLIVQVALAEDHETQARVRQPQGAHRLQQVAMALAGNQLAGCSYRDRVFIEAELASLRRTIGRFAERFGVDRTANDFETKILDTACAQDLRDCF